MHDSNHKDWKGGGGEQLRAFPVPELVQRETVFEETEEKDLSESRREEVSNNQNHEVETFV